MNVLVFDIKNLHFAMPIDALERIIERQQKVYRVPLAPGFINGIINFQGRIITAVDLGELFNAGDDADKRFILISKSMGNIGYLVKKVVGFLTLEESVMEDARKFEGDKENREFIKYIGKGKDEKPISIIDISRVETYLKNPKNWSI